MASRPPNPPPAAAAAEPRAAVHDMDIEAYARLQMKLLHGDRAAVLAEHGLDEESYDALDDRMQAQLSAAIDQATDTAPELLVRFDAALRGANAADEPRLTLEQFAKAMRAIQRSTDPSKTLAEMSIAFGDFLSSAQAWATRMAKDETLAHRFAELMR